MANTASARVNVHAVDDLLLEGVLLGLVIHVPAEGAPEFVNEVAARLLFLISWGKVEFLVGPKIRHKLFNLCKSPVKLRHGAGCIKPGAWWERVCAEDLAASIMPSSKQNACYVQRCYLKQLKLLPDWQASHRLMLYGCEWRKSEARNSDKLRFREHATKSVSEFRPAAAARQRGEKKPEARNPND